MRVQFIQDVIDKIRGKKKRKRLTVIKSEVKVLNSPKLQAVVNIRPTNLFEVQNKILNLDLDGLFNAYNLLSDNYSKNIFTKVIKYRILRLQNILPLAVKDKENQIQDILEAADENDLIDTSWTKLYRYNLNVAGHELNLYSTREGHVINFILKQYEYTQGDVDISVSNGDYVIDGGSCYGENAVIFAHNVGSQGKVFSFEFLKENLDVWYKNINLNPKLKDRIILFENALWNNSRDNLYVCGNGPGTYCTLEPTSDYKSRVKTRAIDDMVNEGKIEKIDFIKLDIEGAELEALTGAEKTIKKFTPKLAICLYHKDEHFVSIINHLNGIVPEYSFYLKHHTDIDEETVLYAIKKKG